MRYLSICIGVFFCTLVGYINIAMAGVEVPIEKQRLDFGVVNKQSGTKVRSKVTYDLGGVLLIKDKTKNPPDNINITIQSDPNSCDTPASIKIRNFSVQYGSLPVSEFSGFGPFTINVPNPGKRGENLKYGATVVVGPNAPSSNSELQHPCYHVDVEYDCVSGTPGCPSSSKVTSNLTADVKVLGIPIELKDTQPMDFGRVILPDSNDTITLYPDGSLVGGVMSIDSNVGKPAMFEVTAEKKVGIYIYAVPGEADSSGVVLKQITASFNGSNMPEGQNITGSKKARLFNTSANGKDTLVLGGKLSIPKRAESGDHTVYYTLVIDYQ